MIDNFLDEITAFDSVTTVYKNDSGLYFYVVGDSQENELILLNALNCLYEACSQLLVKGVYKQPMMENLNFIFLLVDELCEEGILLETDANALVTRVGQRIEDIPFGEQTVSQALENAREKFKIKLMK